MLSDRINLKHELFGAWNAPFFTIGTLVGWLLIARFIDPASADLTAEQTKQWFTVDHRDGVLLGCSIFLLSSGFLAIWTSQLAINMWRVEGRNPLMALVQYGCGIAIVVIVVINCSLWLGAAYRPAADASVVVALNDAAWLGFLIAWPILSIQMLATARITLLDPGNVFPKWLSWASIAGAVALVTAGGPAFTHSGTFAFHGFLGFYLPVIIWGTWMDAHAFFMRLDVRRRMARRT
jgi:hypothetical protein